jgi:hypothetical protein
VRSGIAPAGARAAAGGRESRAGGQLDSEVVVASSFVGGRLTTSLSPFDLEDWYHALDLLAAGQDICWRDDDSSPEIRIQPHNAEHETTAVRVEAMSSSCVSVFLPMRLEEGWINEQRRLLGLVRKEWPSEILQSSPGVHEWRR